MVIIGAVLTVATVQEALRFNFAISLSAWASLVALPL